MKPHTLVPVALAFAAAVAAAPVSAQLYKWVDENGATHYSDRKPDDQKTAVKPVDGAPVSVYSPDKKLLQAVENARDKASRNEPPPEPERTARQYVAPVAPPPPLESDPCASGDCGGYYYPYAPAYAPRRHGQKLRQAVLPPGAIAGNVNSPGIIPGLSSQASTGAVQLQEPARHPPRARPVRPQRHASPEPQR